MALITLDKKAYERNLSLIIDKAGGASQVICVMKNNAYGHGIELIAPLAKQMGVDFIALKNESEALFMQGFFKNILILSHHPNGAEKAEFIYALNAKDDLARLKSGTRVHLAIDTGMHRNGVFVSELEELFDKAKRHNIYIEGLFTHFACPPLFLSVFLSVFLYASGFVPASPPEFSPGSASPVPEPPESSPGSPPGSGPGAGWSGSSMPQWMHLPSAPYSCG